MHTPYVEQEKVLQVPMPSQQVVAKYYDELETHGDLLVVPDEVVHQFNGSPRVISLPDVRNIARVRVGYG